MTINKEMRILVVDDYQAMVLITKNLLKQLGFSDIDTANDGTQALGKIAEKSYDLIISDWSMAPMTGFELLKTLRMAGNTVPFIMVTAESKTENVMAARAAGVSGYIIKPFNADTLKARLTAVFGEF